MLSTAEGTLSCIPDSRPTVAGWQGPGQRPEGEGDVEPWIWVPGSGYLDPATLLELGRRAS